MAKDPSNRPKTPTRPGLGSTTGIPRIKSSEMKRPGADTPLVEGQRVPSPPPPAVSALVTPPPRRVRDSIRREDDDSPPISTRPNPGPASKKPSWKPEAPSGTRAKPRSDRPAVAVDQVGETAVKMARARRESAPKLIVSRSIIEKAPLDARMAFVLSLVDGRNSTAAIIDMSGMPEEEVKAILDRLARLGLIQLP